MCLSYNSRGGCRRASDTYTVQIITHAPKLLHVKCKGYHLPVILIIYMGACHCINQN